MSQNDAQQTNCEKVLKLLHFFFKLSHPSGILPSMKCITHNTEAVAVCVWCGKALCSVCAKPSASQRMICSDNCAAALDRQSKAMDTVLQKSLQSTRANAYYYFLCATLTAGGGLEAWRYLPSPFLVWFCFGAAAVFTASGFWYLVIARKSGD